MSHKQIQSTGLKQIKILFGGITWKSTISKKAVKMLYKSNKYFTTLRPSQLQPFGFFRQSPQYNENQNQSAESTACVGIA
jgi:hypothetical protein